jgi:hypothetical protein
VQSSERGGGSSRDAGTKIVVENCSNDDKDNDDDGLLAEVGLHETIVQRLMKGLFELSTTVHWLKLGCTRPSSKDS